MIADSAATHAADVARISPRNRRRLLLLAGGVCAAAVGLLALRSRLAPVDLGSDHAVPFAAVQEAFTRGGIDAGTLTQLLTPSAAVAAFARASAGTVSGPFAQAEAVVAALRARAQTGAFEPWSLDEVPNVAVRAPDALLSAANRAHAKQRVYPLELAALAVTSLRSLGVDAMVAELVRAKDARAPLDPSGYLGYFVVQVRDEHAASRAFDPWGGRTLSDETAVKVVPDASAVGAALAIQAVYESAFRIDSERALRLSGDALIFAGSMPSVRSARGVVVLSAGMAEQALQELEAAMQLRSDAARLNNAASALLIFGETERATTLLTRALDEAPDFAAARMTQAVLSRAAGDEAALDSALAEAEALAPELSSIQFAIAERSLAADRTEDAIARARRASEARPAFDTRLRYAVLLRKAARYDEMRSVVNGLLKDTPPYRLDEVRTLLSGALGPTALEPLVPNVPAQGDAKSDRHDQGGADTFKLDVPTLGPRKAGVHSRDVSVLRGSANPKSN